MNPYSLFVYYSEEKDIVFPSFYAAHKNGGGGWKKKLLWQIY